MAFSGQFSLLARGTSTEDWANILVLVVMAGLWLVAGLTKTMGKKGSRRRPSQPEASGPRRRPGEGWQQRLARKAEEWQRRLEKEAGAREPPKRRPSAQETASRSPQTPGGRVILRPSQRGESVMVYERPEPEPPARREPPVVTRRPAPRATTTVGQARPAQALPVETRIEIDLPELGPPIDGRQSIMVESPKPAEADRSQPMVHESGGLELSAVLDSNDPDALRRAILHYEILGRPLALRDQSTRSVAF